MQYPVRYTKEPEGWLAEILGAGGGGLATQGDSLAECKAMAQDAVTEVLIAQFELGQDFSPVPDCPDGWEWVLPRQSAWASLQIRIARKNCGMTVAAAAVACGVAAPTYIRWEDYYKSNATIKTLEIVALALGLKLEVRLAA